MYKKDGRLFYDVGDKCFHQRKGIVVVLGSCNDGDALVKVINPDGDPSLHDGTVYPSYDRYGLKQDPDGTDTYWYAHEVSLKYLGGDYDGIDDL